MTLLNIIKLLKNHPLNRDRKLSSIIRFAKWQVGSRLVPGAIVFDWINGSKFIVRRGDAGLTGNIYTGLHEFPDMGYLLHVLRDEDLFVDVGANIGSYSILACSAVGARGIAFEPVPITYKRLVENMRINDLDQKVTCINKGVGVKQESITFTSDKGAMNHAIAPGEECDNIIKIDVTSLDAALQGESPTLLKIDVEGYETPVLEGAQEILKTQSLHSVIMELNGSGDRYGYDESRILQMMFDYNFQTYSYNPLNRTLINLQGKNQNSGNTLFIRHKSLVENKLKAAPMVSVHGRVF